MEHAVQVIAGLIVTLAVNPLTKQCDPCGRI